MGVRGTVDSSSGGGDYAGGGHDGENVRHQKVRSGQESAESRVFTAGVECGSSPWSQAFLRHQIPAMLEP
jgi:hypothetical protein